MDIFSFCNWPMVIAAWIIPFILGILFGWGFSRKHKKDHEDCLDKNKDLLNQINSLESQISKVDSGEKKANAELDLVRSELKDKAAANTQLKADLKKCRTEKEELQKEIETKESDKKDESEPPENIDSEASAQPIFIDDKTKISDEHNLPEQERVMSAISEASLSRVDEIVEKIEAKKSKKNEKNSQVDGTDRINDDQGDDFTKIYQLSTTDQDILYSAGIKSYEKLFLANRQEVASLFEENDGTMDKIKRWQNQAQLAANDLWEAFTKLEQIYLEQDQ